MEYTKITVSATVKAPLEKAWRFWNEPKHIEQWCAASPDWHTTNASNDPVTGGRFSSRMEAKDGSMGFDFAGVYDEVRPQEYIAYTMGDGRKITISFSGNANETTVTETFDAETTNPIEMQRGGWQAIIDSFKNHTESHAG